VRRNLTRTTELRGTSVQASAGVPVGGLNVSAWPGPDGQTQASVEITRGSPAELTFGAGARITDTHLIYSGLAGCDWLFP